MSNQSDKPDPKQPDDLGTETGEIIGTEDGKDIGLESPDEPKK